jgi:hypothetical protein
MLVKPSARSFILPCIPGDKLKKKEEDCKGTPAFPTTLLPQRTQKVVAKSTLLCTHCLQLLLCKVCCNDCKTGAP